MNKSIEHSNNEQWYVLRVMPKSEFKSSKFLLAKNISHYMPVVKKKRQWSDRVKYIDFPVFSGYIFVQINFENSYLDILSFQSHIDFIKNNDKPATISEQEMFELKTILEKGEEIQNDPTAKFPKGTKIEITYGPFKGIIGVIHKIKNQQRISIDIEILGRTISSQLKASDASKGNISRIDIAPEDIDVIVG